jgi:hypothetical protein
MEDGAEYCCDEDVTGRSEGVDCYGEALGRELIGCQEGKEKWDGRELDWRNEWQVEKDWKRR